VTWAQEEPRNMGPWSYIEPRMKTATRVINNKEMSPHYVGRDPSAATATGLGGAFHNKEQALIIKAAFA
jgi:2-oxoglutarate dehydrogenase E1 component